MNDGILPETCAIAFKEWAGVCEALAGGRQSLILRKGGIDEGPGGFKPEHDVFWLYPTEVHQAQQGLKPEAIGPVSPDAPAGTVGLRALVKVELIERVDDLARLAELDDMHVWTEETVEKRFHYRSSGLWVLGLSVYRRARPFSVPMTPFHAGCKTWVELESALPTEGLEPALDEATRDERLRRISSILSRTSST